MNMCKSTNRAINIKLILEGSANGYLTFRITGFMKLSSSSSIPNKMGLRNLICLHCPQVRKGGEEPTQLDLSGKISITVQPRS
jgi:hypothetical protein